MISWMRLDASDIGMGGRAVKGSPWQESRMVACCLQPFIWASGLTESETELPRMGSLAEGSSDV